MRGCVYLCGGRIIMYEVSRMCLRYIREACLRYVCSCNSLSTVPPLPERSEGAKCGQSNKFVELSTLMCPGVHSRGYGCGQRIAGTFSIACILPTAHHAKATLSPRTDTLCWNPDTRYRVPAYPMLQVTSYGNN